MGGPVLHEELHTFLLVGFVAAGRGDGGVAASKLKKTFQEQGVAAPDSTQGKHLLQTAHIIARKTVVYQIPYLLPL